MGLRDIFLGKSDADVTAHEEGSPIENIAETEPHLVREAEILELFEQGETRARLEGTEWRPINSFAAARACTLLLRAGVHAILIHGKRMQISEATLEEYRRQERTHASEITTTLRLLRTQVPKTSFSQTCLTQALVSAIDVAISHDPRWEYSIIIEVSNLQQASHEPFFRELPPSFSLQLDDGRIIDLRIELIQAQEQEKPNDIDWNSPGVGVSVLE